MTEADIIIIGAGAAGLIAARELSLKGLKVLLLEAQDRVGGRICTINDKNFCSPVKPARNLYMVNSHLRYNWYRKQALN